MTPHVPLPIGSAAAAAPCPSRSDHAHRNHGASSIAYTFENRDTAAVRRVRQRVRAFLTDREVPDCVLDDVLLVLSELLTNAFLHARPPAVLRVSCVDRLAVGIEVSDGGPRLTAHAPASHEEHGRGVEIIAALCASHGSFSHDEGMVRWARVGCGQPDAAQNTDR
ncbi:ATP-binding protein [Streptomyces sp. NPDC048663]|uniref:ATP-binding protein n=1 Tax=Streptomyces sp. NPDC048663 TaxID=3155638 RepID=UPI003434FEF3